MAASFVESDRQLDFITFVIVLKGMNLNCTVGRKPQENGSQRWGDHSPQKLTEAEKMRNLGVIQKERCWEP